MSIKFTRLHLRKLRCMQLTCACAIESPFPFLTAWRALKHRSLASDDPFGENSASSDPSEGFYAAWSGVDIDAFASAAASEEVRTAHFGPEWARFTTVGRMSAKKMKEQGAPGMNFAAPTTDGDEAMPHSPTAEELHARELQARRKSLEKNYATYEEYVVKELGIEDGGDEDVHVGEEMDDGRDVEGLSEDTISLPQFMSEREQQERSNETATSELNDSKRLLRRREGLQVPEALMQMIFNALGEPHGDRNLPCTDPLHWNTEEVILWITKMEAARCSLISPSGPNSGGDAGTPLMQDPSMQGAFRMARTDGAFLLHHTVPSTLFQVMRRWYLRRQEIALMILKEHQELEKNVTSSMDDVNNAAFRHAVENGKKKLDEAAARVTPLLIQETISQCYPYCH